MVLDKPVYIWDVTLRDGEQTPGLCFSVPDKVNIATALARLRVDYADITFPLSSKQEQEATRHIIAKNLPIQSNVTAMMDQKDIDLALELGVYEVNMMAPVSDIHIEKKFGFQRKDILNRMEVVFNYAKAKGVVVNFVGEDTARANIDFAQQVFNHAFNLGADKLVICDTVGVMYPSKMYDMVTKIITGTNPSAKYAVHCHNDFGQAVANTLAGFEAGAKYLTVTINGIGERAGNAALEQVVLSLEKQYQVPTGLDLKYVNEICQLVSSVSGIPIPPNQPVTGKFATAHAAGIHVGAIIKDPISYEPFDPNDIGRSRSYVVSKHIGVGHITYLVSKYGLEPTKSQLYDIQTRVKELAKPMDALQKVELFGLLDQYYERFGIPLNMFWDIVKDVTKTSNNVG